jgi:hypothetical protein
VKSPKKNVLEILVIITTMVVAAFRGSRFPQITEKRKTKTVAAIEVSQAERDHDADGW